MKSNQRQSLLKIWTTRYLITLVIGLFIIGVIASAWIQHSARENRLDMMKFLAGELSERIGTVGYGPHISQVLNRIISNRVHFLNLQGQFLVLILDQNGKILYTHSNMHPKEVGRLNLSFAKVREKDGHKKIKLKSGETFLAIENDIFRNRDKFGTIFILHSESGIKKSPHEMKLLIILLSSIGLLGWIVIYFLAKRLSQPIQNVANAAHEIKAGNYDFFYKGNHKEKEIHELQQSFQEMANRLKQLEALRTELLAGVTHELKTPVTSISGLVQAVKDDVVEGEQAKEFLNICHHETIRLQKMLEDLLDFNSFASGAVKVRKQSIQLDYTLKEIINKWKLTHALGVHIHLSTDDIPIYTDPSRIEQIIVNLLNNAFQAEKTEKPIDIFVEKNKSEVYIHVKDYGRGIPVEEQPLIFEKFYRGEGKKHVIHGLGLGLPFSRMLARAMDGDLQLKESTEDGTIFTLTIPNL